MAVFTEVSIDEAQRLMQDLHLGQLTELRGILLGSPEWVTPKQGGQA